MSDPAEYVREVERYLCQKNRGHLIRVVGPAFDLVCGWVARGVPLKVAFRGIDRRCERYDAKGSRRRPLRIEFCEQDVLDAFDEWRRAVGVTAALAGEDEDGGEARARRPALGAHIERAVARLAYARGSGAPTTRLHEHLDSVIRELEVIAPSASRVRGDARESLIARLAELDAALIEVATAELSSSRAAELQQEAVSELAPFGARMPPAARDRAISAAFHRLVREAFGLPTLTYE